MNFKKLDENMSEATKLAFCRFWKRMTELTYNDKFRHPMYVLSGSTALVLEGNLEREVNDIDLYIGLSADAYNPKNIDTIIKILLEDLSEYKLVENDYGPEESLISTVRKSIKSDILKIDLFFVYKETLEGKLISNCFFNRNDLKDFPKNHYFVECFNNTTLGCCPYLVDSSFIFYQKLKMMKQSSNINNEVHKKILLKHTLDIRSYLYLLQTRQEENKIIDSFIEVVPRIEEAPIGQF